MLVVLVGLSFLLLGLEFRIAEWTRWKWLEDSLVVPAATVQSWLVNARLVPLPQVGGHMPDMTYIVLFDLVVNCIFAAVVVLMFVRVFQKRRIREQR